MNINETQDRIVEDFNRMTDWFAKYEYLIDLGAKHPPLAEGYKTEEYALAGCQSQVWIHATLKNGGVFFFADSDSQITKGMIALVLKVLNGQPAESVAQADIYFTERTGLVTDLSPARANGLQTIVSHMRYLAKQLI